MKPRVRSSAVPPRAVMFMALAATLAAPVFIDADAPAFAQAEGGAPAGQEASPEPVVQQPKLPERPKTVSLETLRMMEKIEIKTRELKKREEQIRIREAQVKKLEARVKEDLQKIEAALKKSQELMNVSTDLREENLDSLVKIYSAMRPDDAAPLVAALDEKIAIQILSRMKSKIAGQVMGKLDTQSAKKLSEKIIGTDVFGRDKK